MPKKEKNPHAQSLAYLRAASMTPERRKEISEKAAAASVKARKLRAKKNVGISP